MTANVTSFTSALKRIALGAESRTIERFDCRKGVQSDPRQFDALQRQGTI
jgi:hypothetical protein